MREYELTIDKALLSGLSPEPVPVNAEFLSQCLGFRCGKTRLESHVLLTNPIPVTVDMYYSWPFPQFISGDKYNLLIVRDTLNHQDTIYSLSADHATVTHVFDIDELTFGVGGLMEVADFGEYVFLTNGVCMVIWDVALNAWRAFIADANIPMMKAVCNFRGQAIGGNVISSWHDCDETYYVWSKIGAMDFTPDQGNEAGYRRDPFGGEVYHVRRLGENAIGYSSKGVIRIYPVNAPASTMGFEELHDVGLINKGAFNGNLREHVFVDSDFNVWRVGIGVDVGGLALAKVNPMRLGYQSYMEQLDGEDIIVSYDSAKGDFYIGNSIKTFLLSPKGLTEVLQHPSSVWRSNKQSWMVPDADDGRLPVITSEAFDMVYGGQKTLSVIESDAAVVSDPEAGADCTFDNNIWMLANYKAMNNQGIASAVVSGNAFRASIRFGTIYNNSRISYIKVRFKMTDLRGIRGVYAPPTSFRGQQGA
jgi:hypothetical protein